MPCLRRATAVNYTDADEDSEKLMSFMDEVGHSSAGIIWVLAIGQGRLTI